MEQRRKRPLCVLVGSQVTVGFVAFLLIAPAHGFDEFIHRGPDETRILRTMEATALLASACPTGTLRVADLDAARRLNERAALHLALDEAERKSREREKLDPLNPGTYKFADDPGEASLEVRRHYGPDSFLTRGAVAVLAIADAAERGSQVPLDRINTVTDTIVEASREALGWKSMPALRLESRLRYNRAGVSMSGRW